MSDAIKLTWMNASYLVASLCFILTLQQLGSPKTARRGVAATWWWTRG